MGKSTLSFYIANRMKKQLALGFLLLGFLFSAQAQLKVLPIEANPSIKTYLKNHPDYQWNFSGKLHKKASKDTLQLPFFEDFINDHIYPDSSRWLDNLVYVNRSFGIRPPTYGVATFDHLDPDGNPYNNLHNTDLMSADTLTSQCIDLTDLDGHNITKADSLYLSFFYQPKGRGQQILSNDELRLSFKDTGGNWIEVWLAIGSTQVEFEQILIPIDNDAYLHDAFQFRFNNITHRWGNNNHWHIDYIELDTGRTFDDLYNRDVAIQSPPTSMLKNYSVLPYEHFLADAAGERQTNTEIRLSNRSDLLKQISVKYSEAVNSTVIGSIDNFSNIDNCNAYDDTARTISLYNFSGLSGNVFTIDRTYICKEDSQESIRRFQFNDTIVSHQVFDNYYAKDDGSAEAGFGFDNLIGRDGSIAVRFDLKQKDTLHGVGFYFTQINHDVSDRRFTIKVWRSIAVGGDKDSLVYEEFRSTPTYSNRRNGYTYYPLTQEVILDAGTFYIGWTQDQDFSLNVGLDQNHGRILGRGTGANPDIFYHIGSGWIANSNTALFGSPMIRAYVGEYKDPTVSVEKVEEPEVTLYPNPTEGNLYLKGVDASFIQIYSPLGQLVAEPEIKNGEMNLSGLRNGRYLLRWMNESRTNAGAKWITIHR